MSLEDLLADAAEGLDGVEVRTSAGGTEWGRGGRVFATLTGEAAEFRLDPLVAGAALRTPDTAPSLRGPEWVRFAPGVLDDAAVDRAEAWFAAAWRRAGG